MLTGTVQDSENRLARMDFKIAVELSKLSQVIAYTHDVDEESLNRLHVKCVDEVRRINGTVKFEDAYHYQKRMCRYCWKGNDGKRIYLYFPQLCDEFSEEIKNRFVLYDAITHRL